MIPITRKEKYINEIVGGGDTAPETPYTREEFFLAEILGEVIAPSPVTRVEKYLSAIAGQYSGEMPEPVTRIERFIARAAGMDVTIPTPITREEMFWADYALIVEKKLSGIPPLTFNAIAGTLKDYRIYGNTAGGESVGDLVATGEHAGEYKVPVTVSNGADTQTIPIYLTEQIKMVGDEAEYIDFGQQKQHRVRKNLLQNTTTSREINGVTFTVNSDRSIICNGQASSKNADLINPNFLLPSGTYILTGCPDGGSDRETYKMLLYVNGAWRTNDRGSGANFTLTETSTMSVRIVVYAGYTCDNLTFYPMIRKADIEDDTYEPYITNTELDVTLPALPTLSGTNTLTVGTEVQPSNVYIKYEGAR